MGWDRSEKFGVCIGFKLIFKFFFILSPFLDSSNPLLITPSLKFHKKKLKLFLLRVHSIFRHPFAQKPLLNCFGTKRDVIEQSMSGFAVFWRKQDEENFSFAARCYLRSSWLNFPRLNWMRRENVQTKSLKKFKLEENRRF